MPSGASAAIASERDLYALLGVAPDATTSEITAAFRALAKELHPDAAPADAEADEAFKALSRAYATLTKPRSRAAYDARRAARRAARHASNVAGRGVAAAPAPAPQQVLATPRRARWAVGGGVACIVAGLAIAPVLLTMPTGPDTVGRDVTLWIVVAKLVICGALLVGFGWWRLLTLPDRR